MISIYSATVGKFLFDHHPMEEE